MQFHENLDLLGKVAVPWLRSNHLSFTNFIDGKNNYIFT
jgi:hypothetical protein